MTKLLYCEAGSKFSIPSREIADLNIDIAEGAWIAGGAALSAYTRQEINDIDLYCRDDAQQTKLMEALNMQGNISFASNNAATFKREGLKNVQVIKLNVPTVQDAIAPFDFTVCQIATDGKGNFVASAATFADIESKTLRINNFVKDKFIKRWIKYNLYGYTMDPKEFKQYVSKVETEDYCNIGHFDGNY